VTPPESTALVSVIVPVFNGQATLSETLDTVIAQSYQNWECIIVDDGSTDGSASIAARYSAKDPRIRCVQKANGGVASARNLGFDISKGDFLAFLDADDIWHPDFLHRHVETLRPTVPAPGFSYCHLRHIDVHSRIIQTVLAHALSGEIATSLAYFNFVGNPSCAVFTRAAMIASGGYDESLRAHGVEGAEDYLLSLQVASRFPAIAIPQYLVGYRQSATSMSADLRRMLASCERAIALFTADHHRLKLPPQLNRWRNGAFALRRAQFAWAAKDIPTMTRLLWSAFSQDPIRNCLVVLIELRKALLRSFQPDATSQTKVPLFADLDPHAHDGAPSVLHRILHRVLDQRLRFALNFAVAATSESGDDR
jgi:glycosyltransferase involved in cell wall biosynthesis